MTVAKAFVNFLETKGYGIFGQNIFLYRVPNSLKTDTELLWVIPSGGMPIRYNQTGEMIKEYSFIINFRSMSAEKIDVVLNDLEQILNCSSCVSLKGFELVSIRATQFPADQDLDAENRMVGMINCSIQVYKGCTEES